jgi:hypothetical protein
MCPKRGSTPRQTDWMTVNCNVTLILILKRDIIDITIFFYYHSKGLLSVNTLHERKLRNTSWTSEWIFVSVYRVYSLSYLCYFDTRSIVYKETIYDYVCYLCENAWNFGLDVSFDNGKECGTLIMRELAKIVRLPVQFSTSLRQNHT